MRSHASEHSEKPSGLEQVDPDILSFNYQLEFLKLEFASINEIIKRIDEITQKHKDWAVLIWVGSISLSVSQSGLRRYVVF
ncbi:MAG: hypothetical protein ACREDR_36115, partial [Blastocatellia bacterium]